MDDEAEHVERITERLRKDHPDPAMRDQLYRERGLDEYVRVLLPEGGDDATVARIAAAVRAREDGQSHE